MKNKDIFNEPNLRNPLATSNPNKALFDKILFWLAESNKITFELLQTHKLERLYSFFYEQSESLSDLSRETTEFVEIAKKISEKLEQNGVRHIFIKGPIIDNLIYGGIGLRKYSDLDILINKVDLGKTKNVLLSEKFTKGYYDKKQQQIVKYDHKEELRR